MGNTTPTPVFLQRFSSCNKPEYNFVCKLISEKFITFPPTYQTTIDLKRFKQYQDIHKYKPSKIFYALRGPLPKECYEPPSFAQKFLCCDNNDLYETDRNRHDYMILDYGSTVLKCINQVQTKIYALGERYNYEYPYLLCKLFDSKDKDCKYHPLEVFNYALKTQCRKYFEHFTGWDEIINYLKYYIDLDNIKLKNIPYRLATDDLFFRKYPYLSWYFFKYHYNKASMLMSRRTRNKFRQHFIDYQEFIATHVIGYIMSLLGHSADLYLIVNSYVDYINH